MQHFDMRRAAPDMKHRLSQLAEGPHERPSVSKEAKKFAGMALSRGTPWAATGARSRRPRAARAATRAAAVPAPFLFSQRNQGVRVHVSARSTKPAASAPARAGSALSGAAAEGEPSFKFDRAIVALFERRSVSMFGFASASCERAHLLLEVGQCFQASYTSRSS